MKFNSKITRIVLSLTAAFMAVSTILSQPVSNWKTHSTQEYSIRYPQKWVLNSSMQNQVKFYIFSPRTSTNDKFRENVNLVLEDLKGQKITLAQYTEASKNQIKQMITNAKIVDEKRIMFNRTAITKIIFTGDQGMFHLTYEQYYVLHGNNAWVLTFTAETSQFVAYQKTAEQIINTFLLK